LTSRSFAVIRFLLVMRFSAKPPFLFFPQICVKPRNSNVSGRLRPRNWRSRVVRGHIAYYAVPDDINAVAAFRNQATRHWYRALRRRSQRTRLEWKQMRRLQDRWLPRARIMHPWPNVRFDVRTQGRGPVR